MGVILHEMMENEKAEEQWEEERKHLERLQWDWERKEINEKKEKEEEEEESRTLEKKIENQIEIVKKKIECS